MLYLVFADLNKAFDSINVDTLWTIFSKTGCLPDFVRNLKQNCKVGVYRTTAKVFDLTCFKAKSMTFQLVIRELLYADLVAHTCKQ